MKKRVACCLLIMALIVVVFSMFSSTEAAEKLKIPNMQIMTGDAGGTWGAIGAAIAEKVNDNYQGFPMTAVPSSGSVANPMVIGSGEAPFGLSYPIFLVAATKGAKPYSKAFPDLRAICAMPPTVLHMFADVAIPGKTIKEILDAKTVFKLGLPPKGSGSYSILDIVFNACGLEDIEDLNQWGASVYYASGQGLGDAWNDRITDMTASTYNVPAAILVEALSARQGKILGMGEEIMPKLMEYGFSPFTIPSGTYPNQDEDVETVSLPMILFTRADVSEDVVYTITKTIYQNAEYMKTVHSSFKSFDNAAMHKGNGIQLHEGAVKFFKERGIME